MVNTTRGTRYKKFAITFELFFSHEVDRLNHACSIFNIFSSPESGVGAGLHQGNNLCMTLVFNIPITYLAFH